MVLPTATPKTGKAVQYGTWKNRRWRPHTEAHPTTADAIRHGRLRRDSRRAISTSSRESRFPIACLPNDCAVKRRRCKRSVRLRPAACPNAGWRQAAWGRCVAQRRFVDSSLRNVFSDEAWRKLGRCAYSNGLGGGGGGGGSGGERPNSQQTHSSSANTTTPRAKPIGLGTRRPT
jgi:hypothetical protein